MNFHNFSCVPLYHVSVGSFWPQFVSCLLLLVTDDLVMICYIDIVNLYVFFLLILGCLNSCKSQSLGLNFIFENMQF